MFGRAIIKVGIDPHSILVCIILEHHSATLQVIGKACVCFALLVVII